MNGVLELTRVLSKLTRVLSVCIEQLRLTGVHEGFVPFPIFGTSHPDAELCLKGF